VKSAKSIGVRAGNWLSLKQAQALLNASDITTLKGLGDRAAGWRRCVVDAARLSVLESADHSAPKSPRSVAPLEGFVGALAPDVMSADRCKSADPGIHGSI
jgi:hypothetical protein